MVLGGLRELMGEDAATLAAALAISRATACRAQSATTALAL